MRTLKFIVEGQIIRVDPECDFDNLVPGTDGYLQAVFSFSKEWNDCIKVASFYSMMGTEYEPQMLTNGQSCLIPAEALKRRVFKIQVSGRGRDSKKLKTNRLAVRQNGG